LAEGKHKYFYPDGKVRLEGKFKQGLKEGDWVHYEEDGTVHLVISYKRGVEVRLDGVKVKDKMSPLKPNAVEQ